MSPILPLRENVYLQKFPLRLAGCRMGRTVTVIRLQSGKLVVHSTAPFTAADVAAIRALGAPGWLVEATNFHDTMARRGRAAFADLPYLVPPGFRDASRLGAISLAQLPDEWAGELDVIEIDGMPSIREHAFYHRPSRTLILADLMFNLPPDAGWWTHAFLRLTAGIKQHPGNSRLFRFCIKDRGAFMASLDRIAALDFACVVVAHGEPIEDNARMLFLNSLARHGFECDQRHLRT